MDLGASLRAANNSIAFPVGGFWSISRCGIPPLVAQLRALTPVPHVKGLKPSEKVAAPHELSVQQCFLPQNGHPS